MKILGTSKVSTQTKVTIIEEVAEILNINVGDRLVFLISDSKDIIIKKLSDVETKEV